MKYRIVTDLFAGYEVQCKRWWFPFWIQRRYTNTHKTVDKAKDWIDKGCPRITTRTYEIIIPDYQPSDVVHYSNK